MCNVTSTVQCAASSGVQSTEAQGVCDEGCSDVLTQFILLFLFPLSFCEEMSAEVQSGSGSLFVSSTPNFFELCGHEKFPNPNPIIKLSRFYPSTQPAHISRCMHPLD